MRRSVVLLLLSTCELVMADSYWKTSGNAGTSFEKIACARKCDAERARVCAILEPDGTCSCDECYKNITANTYMARKGRSSVPESSSIFLPFTSTANNFKSLGSENVPVTVVGSPMQFTQDGPSGLPVEQKALHLDSSPSRYLKYSIPQSLIDSALSEGFIISCWVNFLRAGSHQELIWEFGNAGAKGYRFIQYPEGRAHLGLDNLNANQYTLSTGWHHYVAIFNKVATQVKLYQDGNLKFTISGTPALTQELYFGHRIGDARTTSAAVACFVMQTADGRSENEILAAIPQLQSACNNI